MFRSISKSPTSKSPLLRFYASLTTTQKLEAPAKSVPETKTAQAAKRLLKNKDPGNDPIAKRLYNVLFQDSRKRTGDRTRVHVLSAQLCDDVIERLAPSLEQYKGCDIIDVSPGLCVFSAKLHDHLKPRTHLLLEHEGKIYEQFYKPLLEQEGSKYKLIPENGLLWETLNALPQHLPNQQLIPKGDPRLYTHNNTLLFVANLGRIPITSSGMKTVAHLFIYQLMAASRNHVNFHQYGLIRMLLWVDDKEKNIILPRFVCDRTKYTVETELAFGEIVEVASHDVASTRTREFSLELERAKQVAKRMESDGIRTPERRARALGSEAVRQLKHPEMVSSLEGSGVYRPYMKELVELQARFDSGELAEYEPATEDHRNNKGTGPSTPERLQLQKLKWRFSAEQREYERLEKDIAQFMLIASKEESLKDLPEEELEKAKEEIEKLWNDLYTGMHQLHHNYRDQVQLRLDDRRIFYQKPPALLWDRRPYEPLKVEATEFYPKLPLALLDFQPRIVAPVLRDISNYDHFEFILTTFWMLPKKSVKEALESLAPGACEWIVKECPSLTDPSQGGSSNLDLLKVRSLTQTQFVEILQSWLNWPFRPSDGRILSRMGMASEFDHNEYADDTAGALARLR